MGDGKRETGNGGAYLHRTREKMSHTIHDTGFLLLWFLFLLFLFSIFFFLLLVVGYWGFNRMVYR